MEKMFICVLDQTVTVSVVILAVILARFVLRRAPRWIVCALWAAVAIRLLVPVSIESPFSLVPDVQSVQTRMEAAYVQNSRNLAGNSVAPGAYYVETSDKTGERDTSVLEQESWMPLVVRGAEIVWLIGIGVLFMYALGSYLRMRRKVAAAYRIESDVYVCDEVAGPFILGMFRPRIYLPSGMDEDFRECVIAHERAHLMRRDHLWKPLGYLLLAIYWFHPLCWIAYVLLGKDIEVACDERATRSRTNDWKATYCQALLFAGSGKRRIAVSPVAFGEISVRERVKGIINYKKPKPWVWLLAAVVVVVIFVCFMTNPSRKNIGATYSYEDTECSISVQIPAEWTCKTVENYVGDEKTEGSPDCGVEIYTEDSVTPDIYIFRQVGKIAEPTEDIRSSTAFANVNGLKGTRYKLQDEGRVSELIIMDNAFYGISITVDSRVYEQNKQKIESVLESVVIQTK